MENDLKNMESEEKLDSTKTELSKEKYFEVNKISDVLFFACINLFLFYGLWTLSLIVKLCKHFSQLFLSKFMLCASSSNIKIFLINFMFIRLTSLFYSYTQIPAY